jgi:hypothetical protein
MIIQNTTMTTNNIGSLIYIGTLNNKIYKSNNFGESWNSIGIDDQKCSQICCSSDGSIVAAAFWEGYIYISYNYGNTWHKKITKQNWISIDMSLNGNIMVACATNGKIYISYDFGESWEFKTINRFWTGISCSHDCQNIVGSCFNQEVYISNDYGDTWIGNDNYDYWSCIDSSKNTSKIIAGTYKHGLYISNNNGLTFTKTTVDDTLYWIKVTISPDGNILGAISEEGYLYISNDSGLTWTTQRRSEVLRHRFNFELWKDIHATDYSLYLVSENEMHVAQCALSPQPTPQPTPTQLPKPDICNIEPSIITDPYIDDILFENLPKNYSAVIPDIFQINIKQNGCSIFSNIISETCLNSNRKFCNIQINNTTHISSLSLNNIKLLDNKKSIKTSTIWCADYTLYPLFSQVNQFVLIYQPKIINSIIFFAINNDIYNINNNIDTIIIHQTNKLDLMIDWIHQNFRFIQLGNELITIKYYHLYCIYKPNDPYTVYINIIPS